MAGPHSFLILFVINFSLDYYNTIEKPVAAEFKDRGSKFIAYAYPLANAKEFKERLKELKKEHPKASHYCFAYRFGLEGNNFRVNDDGEPSGSAGKPILGQIDSKKLTDVLIVVVRYFGGTLLGVPGLVNAYKSVASLALQAASVVQKPVEIKFLLQFDYSRFSEVMRVIKQYDCAVLKKDIQLFCTMEIGIPSGFIKVCIEKLEQIRGMETSKILSSK